MPCSDVTTVDDFQKLLALYTAFQLDKIDESNGLIKPVEPEKNAKIVILIKSSEEVLLGASLINLKTSNAIGLMKDTNLLYYNISDWDSVEVRFIGHHPVRFRMLQTFEPLIISLPRLDVALEEFVVKGYLTGGIDYVQHSQQIEISRLGAGLLPGETDTDILTSIEALPGINSPDGKAGNLIMRGDDPDKTLLTYDEIPIYHNGHYFGAFSPFNFSLVDKVSISRGGYTADQGGRVGGIVAIKSIGKIPEKLEIQTGMSSTYLTSNFNLPLLKDRISLVFGARFSPPFEFNSLKLKAITDFVFQNSAVAASSSQKNLSLQNFGIDFYDVNAKLNYKINANQKFELSFLNIKNDFILDVLDDRKNDNLTHRAILTNWGFSAIHKFQKNKFESRVVLIKSFFEQDFYTAVINPVDTVEESNYQNIVDEQAMKAEVGYRFGRQFNWKSGYQLTDYRLFSYRDIVRTKDPFLDHDDQSSLLHAFFSNVIWQPGSKLDIEFGARISYFELLNRTYVEPRIKINYFVAPIFTLKANAGRYHQFTNHLYGTRAMGAGVENYNWRLSSGDNTPVVDSDQLMGGFILADKGWVWDTELYFKSTSNITTHNQKDYQNTAYHYVGDYATMGFDMLLKKRIENWEFWMAYSQGRTWVSFEDIQPDDFLSVWSQQHLINQVITYQKGRFKCSFGFKYKSGLATLTGIRYLYLNGPFTAPVQPFGPPDEDYSNRRYTRDSDPDYGDFFPNYWQSDLSCAYLFKIKNKVDLNIGLACGNLFDAKIITGQVEHLIEPGPQPLYKRVNLYGIGRTPSFKVSLAF